MKKLRLLAAGSAAVLLAAGLGGSAVAEQTGVGSAEGSSTVLDVNLFGSVAWITAVRDSSATTTDPSSGPASARAGLVPLTVASDTNDALDFTSPEVSVATNKGQDARSESPTALPAELGPIATAAFNPVDLLAVVDQTGARATLESAAADLAIGGAILTADAVTNQVSTAAATTSSSSSRSVSADTVTVLDLGTLLAGLGIDLSSLPTDNLLGALEAAGLTVPDVGDADDVRALIDDANLAIDELQDVKASLLPDVSTEVDGILGELIPGSPVDTTDVAEIDAAIDELQGVLAGTLGDLLEVLDGAALAQLNDVTVGVATTANDKVDTSSASVTGGIGSISVGGLTIPGADLLATATELEATAASVGSQIDAVLGALHPGLGLLPNVADIVSISLLDSGTSVQKAGAYVESLASVTLAYLNVTPPTDLAGLVSTINAGTGIGDEITGLGGTVPEVGAAAGALSTATAAASPLGQGADVKVMSLSSMSNFTPVASAPMTPELPRTGGETDVLLLSAGGLAVLALSLRRRLQLVEARVD